MRENPAAALARKRWAGTTRAERVAFARWVGSHSDGRPRSEDRCPCGEMTKARALKRGHKCLPTRASIGEAHAL